MATRASRPAAWTALRPRPRRDLGLIASEGRLTIPLEDGSAAGVLAVHTTFFEFIPEEEHRRFCAPDPALHELEDGERYYVILTGGNGLYRYDLNDIVEVRGFHRTPRVAFVRKGRDMVSITGEKLHLNQARKRCRGGAGDRDRRLAVPPDPRRGGRALRPPGRAAPAGAPRPRRLRGGVDRALAEVNVEYASKRASGRLAPRGVPDAVRLVRAAVSGRVPAGRRDEQHKWSAIRLEWDAREPGPTAGLRLQFGDGRREPPGHRPRVLTQKC